MACASKHAHCGLRLPEQTPFLSKLTNMGIVMREAVPPDLRGTVPDSVVKIVADTFTKSRFARPAHWESRHGLKMNKRSGVIDRPDDFVRSMLTGTHVASMHGRTKLSAPDPILPAAVAGGQGGIPLEYRKIRVRPSTANLETALLGVVEEARALNLRHVADPAERERILVDARR